MTRPCCPAPCSQPARTVAASSRWKDCRKKPRNCGGFIADQGAEQCGFCNPGMIMNTIALLRENPDPTEDEIREYLAGNLCRCSGYEGQLIGIKNLIHWRKERQTHA